MALLSKPLWRLHVDINELLETSAADGQTIIYTLCASSNSIRITAKIEKGVKNAWVCFWGWYFDGNDDRTKLSDELFSLVDWTAERKICASMTKGERVPPISKGILLRQITTGVKNSLFRLRRLFSNSFNPFTDLSLRSARKRTKTKAPISRFAIKINPNFVCQSVIE